MPPSTPTEPHHPRLVEVDAERGDEAAAQHSVPRRRHLARTGLLEPAAQIAADEPGRRKNSVYIQPGWKSFSHNWW